MVRRGPWVTHGSEVVHRNPWFSVRHDRVDRPDGTPGDYFVVESSPAVFVVALDDAGAVALVHLYRYPVERWSLEVPAGSCDEGEDPLDAARRELAEEADLVAGRWEHLGLLYAANGLLREDNHVFLARALRPAGSDHALRGEEGIDEVRFVDLGRALADPGITDAQTVTALALAAVRLGRLG